MIQEPNCFKRGCIHNIRVEQPDGTEETEVNACDAYPDGIPEEIAYGDELHLEVRDDQDNDIVFEEDTASKKVMANETNEELSILGGSGSGHYGHAGRPGKRGGSVTGGGGGTP